VLQQLQAIALLCQFSAGGNPVSIAYLQEQVLQCQQYYIQCFYKNQRAYADMALEKCVLERKIERR
jgi:hypothetical protein